MKKLIPVLLALSLCLSMMLSGVALAAGDTPFDLVTVHSEDTVTVSVRTDAQLVFANVTVKLTCPDGFTITAINKGADYADFGCQDPVSNPKTGIASILTTDNEYDTTVAAGKEFLIYTLDASEASPGDYTFSVQFTAAADINGKALTWQKAVITSDITIQNDHTHAYGEPTWAWTGDGENGYTAAATFTCTGTAGVCVESTKTLTAIVSGPDTVDATCTAAGSKTWTATTSFDGKSYSDAKTETISALGHTLVATSVKDATCTEAGNNAYWTCSTCGKVFSDAAGTTETTVKQQTIPATGHKYENGVCTVCGATQGAYEVYYELYDSAGAKLTTNADNDTNGSLDVETGGTYTAKVFIKPSADKNLRGFELNLTYDSTNISVTTSDAEKKYDKISNDNDKGTLKYILYQAEDGENTYYEMTANTGLQVAQFAFTVSSNTPADTQMTFGFGETNEVAVVGVTSATVVSTLTPAYVDTLPAYTVTWDATGGTFNGDETSTTTVVYGAAAVAPATDPTRAGYTFQGWYLSSDSSETVITVFPALYANTQYNAKWEAIEYNITYDLNGGTGDETGAYTIENGTLPTPTKTGYIFDSWKVTSVTGESNLNTGDTLTDLTGYYGTVTLTAQWKVNSNFKVVDYTYAPTGYALLIVSAVPGDGDAVLYDGTPMYHITADDAAAYVAKLVDEDGASTAVAGASGVYVTLIPYTEGATTEADVSAKITLGKGTNTELTYNCQIDGDADVDFNDASIVYQMVKLGGGAFSMETSNADDYLGIEARLRADANKDCKGSLEDMETVVSNFS